MSNFKIADCHSEGAVATEESLNLFEKYLTFVRDSSLTLRMTLERRIKDAQLPLSGVVYSNYNARRDGKTENQTRI